MFISTKRDVPERRASSLYIRLSASVDVRAKAIHKFEVVDNLFGKLKDRRSLSCALLAIKQTRSQAAHRICSRSQKQTAAALRTFAIGEENPN